MYFLCIYVCIHSIIYLSLFFSSFFILLSFFSSYTPILFKSRPISVSTSSFSSFVFLAYLHLEPTSIPTPDFGNFGRPFHQLSDTSFVHLLHYFIVFVFQFFINFDTRFGHLLDLFNLPNVSPSLPLYFWLSPFQPLTQTSTRSSRRSNSTGTGFDGEVRRTYLGRCQSQNGSLYMSFVFWPMSFSPPVRFLFGSHNFDVSGPSL